MSLPILALLIFVVVFALQVARVFRVRSSHDEDATLPFDDGAIADGREGAGS